MVAPFIFQEANCLENTETKPVFAKNVGCWMHYPQKTENKGFRRLNRRLTLMHLFIML